MHCARARELGSVITFSFSANGQLEVDHCMERPGCCGEVFFFFVWEREVKRDGEGEDSFYPWFGAQPFRSLLRDNCTPIKRFHRKRDISNLNSTRAPRGRWVIDEQDADTHRGGRMG